jgi:hypothetical protein
MDAADASLTIPQRWVLAVTAMTRARNDAAMSSLAGVLPNETEHAALYLRRGWGVVTPEEVVATLELLHAESGAIAWNMGRAAALAGWAYAAHLMKAFEAWRWMLRAAQRVQRTLHGWAEFGESYASGFEVWSRDEDAAERMREQALELETTAWRDLPWRADLTAVDMPDEPIDEAITVAPGDSILAAIAAANGRATIRLLPGVYRESIRVRDSLTIVGDGDGVVWETANGPCVVVDGGALFAKNVTFRGDGDKHDVIHALRGFARVERCRFEGGRRACRFEDGEFQVVECSFRDHTDSGISAKRGLFVRDVTMTRLTNGGGQCFGVSLLPGSDACVERLTVETVAGSALAVDGGELRGYGIMARGAQASAISIASASKARLAGVRIAECGAGLLVRSGSSLDISNVESTHTSKPHLVVEDSRALVRGARLAGSPRETAVVVDGASAVQLCDVRVHDALAALKSGERASVEVVRLSLSNVEHANVGVG